ncbi:ABC transporter permease [Arhodomonas sp. AD133]|uniref:ABC transporter permease n=1 Tax=Arhodomonas sp. AD133 TaxID=3415009 RepID=UPI003EBA0E7D
MALKLEKRPEPSRAMLYASPLIAGVLTLVFGLVVFAALGKAPVNAFYVFFVQPVASLYGLGELTIKAAPLILIAAGLTVGFRAGVWNIGAEGQLILGGICGGGVALAFHGVDAWWLLPLMILAGTLGGMAWAAIPAFLRTRFNTNEILVSLMLVYVAELLLVYLVNGPLRNPEGFGFPESRLFHEAATWSPLVEGMRINFAFLIALAALAGLYLLLTRLHLGFQIRAAGLAPAAAHYAGINAARMTWLSLLIGGGAAGLAGVNEVAGPIGQLLPDISPEYGFAAIIVAYLGRLHPVGILFAGLLMALIYLGGETAQIALQVPDSVTGVFQGMLLFFILAVDLFVNFRVRITGRSAEEAA